MDRQRSTVGTYIVVSLLCLMSLVGIAGSVAFARLVSSYPIIPLGPPDETERLSKTVVLPKQADESVPIWINENGNICTTPGGAVIICDTSPCEPAGDCTGCDPAAYQVEVTLSGIGTGDNVDVNCGSCGELNGTFTLTNVADCRWEYTAATSCGVAGPPLVSYDGFKIELTKTAFQTTLTVYINRTTSPTGYATLHIYTENSAWDCQSVLVLDDSSVGGTSICSGFPSSATVTPL